MLIFILLARSVSEGAMFKPPIMTVHFPLLLFLNYFIYFLFLAALGVCCCTWAFSTCAERGLLLVAVRGLLIAVASLVAEHGL